MRIAVTIREASAPIAGGRALLDVGAAHEPIIEAYLRAFTDGEIVSVPALRDKKATGCPK